MPFTLALPAKIWLSNDAKLAIRDLLFLRKAYSIQCLKHRLSNKINFVHSEIKCLFTKPQYLLQLMNNNYQCQQ